MPGRTGCLATGCRVDAGTALPRPPEPFVGADDSEQPLEAQVILLGVVLLIIGFIAKIAIIWTIGIIVVVIGAILALLGMAGHAVGGRRHYF
jgi:hypothetical protein